MKSNSKQFLTQNVDLLLIENQKLQHTNKHLVGKLAESNMKHTTLSKLLGNQEIFMKDIEYKVDTLVKREKPMKEELDRITQEKNEVIGRF